MTFAVTPFHILDPARMKKEFANNGRSVASPIRDLSPNEAMKTMVSGTDLGSHAPTGPLGIYDLTQATPKQLVDWFND